MTYTVAIRSRVLTGLLATSGFPDAIADTRPARPGTATLHRVFVRRFLPRSATPPQSAGWRVMVALSRWRIEIGFLFGILVLLTAEPTRRAVVAGLPFMVVGIALRGWARGHLTRRGRLTQTGPYALVRHPLYVGSFLLGLGFAIMASVALVPLGFVIVFAVMYVPKALREEAFLRERYGDEYDAYAQRVGRFVPKLRRASREEWNTEWFSWERVFGHREHLTWLGTAAALVLVWAAAVGWLHRVGMYAQDHVPWLSDLARMR